MATRKDIGTRITAERKRLDLTQAQFAEKCGVKAASQFLYEKGARAPNTDYLLKAETIGVSLSFLFSGTSQQNSTSSVTFSASERTHLIQIYKKTDDVSRDELGRLLDLENRINKFDELLQQAPSKIALVSNS